MPTAIDERPTSHGSGGPAPARARRRWWILAALLVVVAVAAASLGLGGSDGDGGSGPDGAERGDAAARTVPRTQAWTELGFFSQTINDEGIEQFADLEDWLGRDVRYFGSFGDARSVDTFLNNLTSKFGDANLGRFGGDPPFRLVHTMPMAFGERFTSGPAAGRSIEAQWDMLIAGRGGRRELYTDVARRMADAGYGDAIIRLGHEFDGPVSRWYAGTDTEKFKAAWRIIHGLFRDVSPDFRFDYNFMRFNAESSIIAEAYPGDEYVDIIGMDIYDQGWDGAGGVPAGEQAGWSDPQVVWEQYHLPKLAVHRAFAEEHGKPMSFPEWGLGGGGGNQEGRAGGDNPDFIEGMHDWMVELEREGPGLAYHSYFQGNPEHDGPHELAFFPQAEERFRELFGD